MKAILHTRYGPPAVLQLKEVEKPVPKEDEVRVKIHATTVTSSDCNQRNLTFAPKLFLLPMRMQFGLFKPRNNLLGLDFAGEIESAGSGVKRFAVGDQVFGSTEPALGAYAEYICLPEDGALTKKPANLTWEEAAAIPLGGITALYFIRDQGNLQAGQKVLIHGASGGIGTFAVQLAKYFGAEVTGVCSTANVEMVTALGADQVVDYKREDVTKSTEIYDVIFDVVHKISYSQSKHLLKEGGIYLATLPTADVLLQMAMTSLVGDKKVITGTKPANREDLDFLKGLAEAGRLKVVIDRSYPLEQIVEAFKYVEKGHKKGNVVITVRHT